MLYVYSDSYIDTYILIQWIQNNHTNDKYSYLILAMLIRMRPLVASSCDEVPSDPRLKASDYCRFPTHAAPLQV